MQNFCVIIYHDTKKLHSRYFDWELLSSGNDNTVILPARTQKQTDSVREGISEQKIFIWEVV